MLAAAGQRLAVILMEKLNMIIQEDQLVFLQMDLLLPSVHLIIDLLEVM